ncbi:MAG: DNA recombination protein RmuC [Acidobacteriota bacterium]|nr:DNA recombination protein RmuC [Acidobacteriota bacterium]
MFTVLIAAVVALLLGVSLTAVVLTSRSSRLQAQLATLESELAASRGSLSAAQDHILQLTSELKASTDDLRVAQVEIGRLREQLKQEELRLGQQVAQMQQNFAQQLAAERKQSEEKLALLTAARVELSNQFEALANRILEEKSKRFTDQNQQNLSQLLTPLRDRLESFQKKVEEVYVNEGNQRGELSGLVKALMNSTQQVSEGTERLARALTTQSKAQGDLGEMILEKILLSSGLQRDVEYTVQSSFRNEDARNVRPDVIVNLPEDKHLVIDSKVSLTAYSEYVNAADEDSRKAALARHLDSVRKHIKELAEKNYQTLHQLQSIDFVCMFVPIEGAFMAAIGEDSALWAAAYEKNVLLVSPSTLLFVVRTVAHLWRQERQNQNVQDIVNRGAELYDKLVGFVEELRKVGDRLDQAKTSYDDATRKLSVGRGNVIRQAEMLKDLGIKPRKALPQEMVDASEESALLPEPVDEK